MIHPIPESRAEWLALREKHVGASEVAALFGLQPGYAPGLYALWMAKAGRVPLPGVEGVERVEWGLRLEDSIAAGASAVAGWPLAPGVYATHECGLGATLDRVAGRPGPVEEGFGWEGPGCIELKNVDLVQAARGMPWGGDDPPPHVRLQLQAQMLCTGYAWGAVAALVGGNSLRIWRYEAAPALHAEMAARVAAFWASVREGREPAPDGSDATHRAIVAQLPDVPDDEPLDLRGDNQAEEAAAVYARAAAAKKAAEAEIAEARNVLLLKAGGARFARLNGFQVSVVRTEEKPPRAPKPGEMIPGRAASMSVRVKEIGV